MDTPRARSPRALPPLSSKLTAPLSPPPPRLSFAFSQSACSSLFGVHLHPVSMSAGAPIGRVGSDRSYYSRASRHPIPTTSYAGGKENRDRDKNRAPHFFSGIGGSWRKESRKSDTTDGKKPAEEKKKDEAKRALDLGQWVKKYMAAMVEKLRSSYGGHAEREHHRRRPHSFSGRGPSTAREMKEWERWTWRRGHSLSSAPASLRVSPANNGHLSVGASVKVSTSSEESTMEELQSVIEAAIAHCKNSISRAQ